MNSRRSKSSSSATCRAAADEHLALHRLDRLDALAEVGIVDGHVAPADQRLPFGGDRLLDDRLDLGARLGVARHEELADGVMAGLGQGEAELGAFLGEEAVRDLGQHAAAVAERRVGAGRAAMVEVDQDLQALLEDGVRACGSSCRRRSRRRRNRARWRGRRDPARAAATGRRPASGT